MSNIKISNLPQITTYDNGAYIPIVDSGATQTSKIEITDLMRAKDQTLVGSTSLILTSGINLGDVLINSSGDRNTILSALQGKIEGSAQNSTMISTTHDGGTKPTINNGSHCIMGAAYRGSVLENSERSVIFADQDSEIYGGVTNAMLGCETVTFGKFAGGGYKIGALSSGRGNIEAATEYTVIASRDFSTHLQGSNTGSIIASKNTTVEPVSNNAEVMSVINSKFSTLRPDAHVHTIIGCESITIDDSNSSQTQLAFAANAWGGGISGAGIGGNYQKMLLNTYSTQITHGGSRVVAFNSNGGTISATGDHNMLLNTESKDITGSRNKATVIGVWDNNDTTDYENTVYMGAIHNYGPRSGKVVQGGSVSGTVNVDGSLGEMFEFTMAGNIVPNFINLREGQKFLFAIYNVNFAVTGGTINGVGGNVLAKGGSISPSNNSWSYYTGWYDGTRVFLIEENNLSAI